MGKTLVSIALWALGGWLLGTWLGAATGWALFALGLLTMILVSGLQLSRIARWVRQIDDPPPPSVGPWDEILAPIYRKLKQNRLDLKERTRHFNRALLAAEALPDGALTLGPDQALIWCNQTAAGHLGLDLERDRGHSILNILRDPRFAQYASQSQWDKPLILSRGYGNQQRTLSLHLAPYGVGQYLMVTRDITQIERLENTRKDFVANVSHEMRTPLTVLSGFIETLLDWPAADQAPEAQRHYLELMAEQAHNMQALVDDLLTLSALESTTQEAGSPVDMAALIRAALEQALALSQGRHRFESRIDDQLQVCGQAGELASAIGNLLTNAVRYTPAEGSITVTWERLASGAAACRVADTGIGIASADIPRLTERFFRANRGRSRATGGTGLGLAIARHVVMRHDAELQIESTPGQGSTFSIILPPARVLAAGPPHDAPAAQPAGPAAGPDPAPAQARAQA
ncbi:phosphate regulon sensor histidine kinase PhoR [Castellaniella sp.]|uniref:phosphate regulon sensor histidine kinase PhoR n=1 Tax=Castellaniella sp. TaxID=1955812 RepID=UPI0035687B30